MPPVNTPSEQEQQQPILSPSIQASSRIVYYHLPNSISSPAGALPHGRNEAHVDADNERSAMAEMIQSIEKLCPNATFLVPDALATSLAGFSLSTSALDWAPYPSSTLRALNLRCSPTIRPFTPPPAPHSRDPSSMTVPPSTPLFQDTIAMQGDGAPLAESEMDGKDVDVLVQDGKD
ncbi:hypothetical protein B0H34DRAFT_841072 [Crassisporium funariophilum]|nr:hypothetical protein B0H34DRAFT_841072 [Crassisporium funariophilum]